MVLGVTYEHHGRSSSIKPFEVIYDTIRDLDGTHDDDTLVRFVQFGAYSLDLEIVYWITDMKNWRHGGPPGQSGAQAQPRRGRDRDGFPDRDSSRR